MRPTDLFIVGLIVGLILFYNVHKYWQSRKIKARLHKASRGEKVARELLIRQGYQILTIQERVPVVTKVNGRLYKNHIKADFIVEKNRRRYVVDVKTGEAALQPTSPDNRRQLLEYFLVYRTDGVILLDMENERLYQMEFQLKYPTGVRKINYLGYLSAFLAGAAVILVVLVIVKWGWQ